MKTLYVIRHAKSSWTFNLDDHDRPLGLRGRRDVRIMGKYLSENVPTPDAMISSTASRALHTALFLADEWGFPEEQMLITKELFHAGPGDILEVISRASGDSLAIFGHNPGFTDLVNRLQGEYLDNLSTCAVMGISLDISSWQEVRKAKGKRLFLVTPKRLK